MTDVTVVAILVSEPLVLADGASQTWTLQRGTYEVEVNVKAEGGVRDGVRISWVGADCGQGEKQEHRAACHVEDMASMTIENPTAFGLVASVTGFMNIYRVP